MFVGLAQYTTISHGFSPCFNLLYLVATLTPQPPSLVHQPDLWVITLNNYVQANINVALKLSYSMGTAILILSTCFAGNHT